MDGSVPLLRSRTLRRGRGDPPLPRPGDGAVLRPALRNRFHRQELAMDLLFLAPQLVLYVALTLVPFVVALPIVLTDRVDFLDQSVSFVGFRNFVSIFSSPVREVFLPALGRTAVFVVLNYLMVYLFGMSLALVMYEARTKFDRFFFIVLFLPLMLSGVGAGMLLNMLFARDSGTINLLLLKLGVLRTAIDIKNPGATAVTLPLLVGWRYAGYNMALFLSGLLSIPQETIDASIVDGAAYWQRVRFIYIPQMVPAIVMATIFALIGSVGIFDEPVGMGGLFANRSAEYFAIVLYKFGFGGGASSTSPQSGTLAQAVAMSLTVYLPLICVAFVLTRLQKKLQY